VGVKTKLVVPNGKNLESKNIRWLKEKEGDSKGLERITKNARAITLEGTDI